MPSSSCCPKWSVDPFSQLLFALQLQSFASGGYLQFGLQSAVFRQIKDEFGLGYTETIAGPLLYQFSMVLVSIILPLSQSKWMKNTSLEFLCGIGGLVTILGCILYILPPADRNLYWILLIAQCLQGAGNAVVFVFYVSMFSAMCKERKISRVSDGIGKTTLMAPLGMVLAFLGAAILGVENWRWLYGIGAVLMLFNTAKFFKLSYEYTHIHDPRQPHSRNIDNAAKMGKVLRVVCANPTLFFLVMGISFAAFVVAGFAPFIPDYIVEHLGQEEATTSLFLAAMVPFMTVSIGVGGFLSHFYKWNPTQICTACIGTAGAGTILCGIVFGIDIGNRGPFLLFAALVIITVMVLLFVSAPTLGCIAMLVEHAMIAHAQAVMGIVSRTIGSLTAPLLVALLLDNGLAHNVAFLVVGCGGCFLAMVCFALVAWRTRNEEFHALDEGEDGSTASPRSAYEMELGDAASNTDTSVTGSGGDGGENEDDAPSAEGRAEEAPATSSTSDPFGLPVKGGDSNNSNPQQDDDTASDSKAL